MGQVRSTLLSQRGIAAQWLSRTEGQGLVEYSLILMLVAVALVGALATFQGGLSARYADIASVVASA
jgi:Flp pilus assembly pilin Flp